ncbi:unnamed protein product [Diatraea saccharalis]|uniref:I/LWEQ domain-containing protein n=1 Tax=Diatraea saccharalis TaxID=40085 RepID=A0A9N9R026_9NEOP|nr:unnamed protein product [Diatraea saccharalis]
MQNITFNNQISEKDENIANAHQEIENLKAALDDLQKLNLKVNEEMKIVISEKDKEKQTLEAKLNIADNRRLNAESELQDLLQQNSVLEADLATLKIQLEEAKKEIEKQSSRVVLCGGEAAVEMTQDALAAMDGTLQTERNPATLADTALQYLAANTQMKGNEESIAKSAILVAHSTAQLSAQLTDLSNTSTDAELSDKLNGECRTMLNATMECLECIKGGNVSAPLCGAARARVLAGAQSAAAAAARSHSHLRVDDELAGMDRAIQEAASQIESLLAASRAGDSGVKLEVNGKILDACTTLMAAVKVLVHESRALQTELGDTTTRQHMYRKNPQWSQGLISASKAVVFAAKLLVTSADEAVGASGRLEGVSAAGHEVAGSTAQLVAASRARAPPASAALARLTAASRHVAAATGALVAAVRAAAALTTDTEALDTSALTLTATRRLEMESKVRSLELETALEAERAKLAALRKRHYHLAQQEENGNMENGKE